MNQSVASDEIGDTVAVLRDAEFSASRDLLKICLVFGCVHFTFSELVVKRSIAVEELD